MNDVYVVTLHEGAYVDYSCSLIGVGSTLEKAKMLAERDHSLILIPIRQRYGNNYNLVETLVWELAWEQDEKANYTADGKHHKGRNDWDARYYHIDKRRLDK